MQKLFGTLERSVIRDKIVEKLLFEQNLKLAKTIDCRATENKKTANKDKRR